MVSTKLVTSIIVLMGGMLGGHLLSDPTRNAIQTGSRESINNDKLSEDLRLSRKNDGLAGLNEYIPDDSYRRNLRNHIDGTEAIQNIKDYSVRITTDCGAGTGWFLDYEIPENGRYPTKWFVATNAHVINNFKFNDNPYKQVLPIGSSYREQQRACVRAGETSTQIFLFKDISKRGEGLDYRWEDPELWSETWLKHLVYPEGVSIRNAAAQDFDHYNDVKLVFAHLKSPKLFYAPINFLGSKYEKINPIWWRKINYYKDFAVLEVNFESEEVAKRITDNLYEKKKGKNLNFFRDELLKNKKVNDLAESPEDYFVAGYPGNSINQLKSFGNYSAERQTASRLVSWNESAFDLEAFAVRNKHGQKVLGHVDVGRIDRNLKHTAIIWNGNVHYDWGYNYVINNSQLGPGASGSLVTNRQGDVLGLYRMHNKFMSHGFVEPLKSDGYYEASRIIYPKYDLIKGTSGQLGSYKQQLDAYFPNIKTHLRSIWTKDS